MASRYILSWPGSAALEQLKYPSDATARPLAQVELGAFLLEQLLPAAQGAEIPSP
jgi:hypothetical protein